MPVQSSYLVCATHRSGSNLLCSYLSQTRVCGFPAEYFSPKHAPRFAEHAKLGVGPASDFGAYARQIVKAYVGPNGVFGAKMMWPHLGPLLRSLARDESADAISQATLLNDVFPNLKCVWLRRADTLRQAISHCKARQTNAFYDIRGASAVPRSAPLVYDFGEIRTERQALQQQDLAWKELFSRTRLESLELVYEEITADIAATVGRILQFLNVSMPEQGVVFSEVLRRQSDEVNETWRARYLEDEQLATSHSVWTAK